MKIIRPVRPELARSSPLRALLKYGAMLNRGIPHDWPKLWAGAGDRTYSFDINLLLSDNAAAYTADGYSQVSGADGVLDLGGNQGVTPVQQARMDGMCVIDVTAIDVASGDELYRLKLLGANASTFLAPRVLAEMTLGKGTQKVPSSTLDDGIGRYELPFSTEQANTKYEFLKLYVDVAGTSPSIAFQAFVAVLPEP